MSELERMFGVTPMLDASQVMLTLLLALGLGSAVALTYRYSNRERVTGAAMSPSLILLSMVTAMVMMVIGSNIARAFSLVGALAIIRFRTRMRSPWDISFVFLALVVGIACGAQAFRIAVLGTLSIVLTILMMQAIRPLSLQSDRTRTVCCEVAALEGAEHRVEQVLDGFVLRRSLVEARSQRFGEILSLRYRVIMRDPHATPLLIREVSAIESVERVIVGSGEDAITEE